MPTVAEILDRNTVEYYDCVKMAFGLGNYTNAPWNVSVNSDDYISVGPMISLGTVMVSANFDIDQLDIVLAGIVPIDGIGGGSATVVKTLQAIDYIDQEVTVTRIYVKDGVTEQSEVIYKGYVNGISLAVGETGDSTTAMVKTSSHWVNFQRVNSRYTNIKSQQAFFPNDNGFKYAKAVQKEIFWAEE